ncbi:MAG: DUF1127 domain-containing protein [Sulfitobacter sp.]|nr:DUF1127 domain-containing protein [Sulfitobacter sp.]
MAYTNTHAAGTLPRSTGLGPIQRLIERYKAYRLYRETFDGLNSLSNRELADLGLSRSELHDIATKAVYQ